MEARLGPGPRDVTRDEMCADSEQAALLSLTLCRALSLSLVFHLCHRLLNLPTIRQPSLRNFTKVKAHATWLLRDRASDDFLVGISGLTSSSYEGR